jgi:membrane AbrB-like protein
LIALMVSPALSIKAVLLRTSETLAIATAGAMALTAIGVPAGLVIGSLLGVVTAALAGRPMMVPESLTRVISVLVGISLGAAVSPDTLKGLAAFPLSIAVLAISTLCLIAATSCYLRFVHGWDRQSALLGASPGALAQVMVLSAEYKADIRAIAIVQTMRVVALTIGIPAGLALFGLTVSGSLLSRFAGAQPASTFELAMLVAASTIMALLTWRLRLPGGLMFGAMIASGVLHGGGLTQAALPWWVAGFAIIGIGAVTGARFSGTDPRTLLRFLGAALGSFTVAITITSLFVLVLTALLAVPVADAVVAFSPGAQDTMMVLALALHLDPVFIGALHISRFLLVSLLVPILAHRLRRSPDKPRRERPPATSRPTIED